ncbi:hypothetical protein [Haliangium sp.]|uniref:hypothetical protein n=1 Tax=Haliangium sp. TaxID=2663208 RepID=UPI003D12FA60
MAQITTFGGADVDVLGSIDEASDESQLIQVVPAVVEGKRFTVLLPPKWKRRGHLPVLLTRPGGAVGDAVGPALAAVSRGAVVALAACLGDATSSKRGQRMVAELLDWVDAHGGDKYSVVAVGLDDGGAALTWAANPAGFDYDIHSVIVSDSVGGGYVTLLPPAGVDAVRTLVHLGLWAGGDAGLLLRRFLSTGDPAIFRANIGLDSAGTLDGGTPSARLQRSMLHQFLSEIDVAHVTAVTWTGVTAVERFTASLLAVYLDIWTEDTSQRADYPDYPWYGRVQGGDYPDYPWYGRVQGGDYPDYPWYGQVQSVEYPDYPWYGQVQSAEYPDYPWYGQVQSAEYPDYPWYGRVQGAGEEMLVMVLP